MMRGKAKIELFNAETGELERAVEDHNLVTNALAYIINIEAARGAALTENVFPIATNALGGVLLFDGELDESPDNIHFPTKDVHLVGYASTNSGTSERRGSFNTLESGPTDHGYVSVWDFGTSQANGTIKAVARTNWWSAQNPLQCYMRGQTTTNSGNPSTDTYFYPIRYEGEYLYMLKCYNNHTMKVYRVRKPKLRMKVFDSPSRFEDYEYVAEWNTLACEFEYKYYNETRTVQYWADSPKYYYDGRDGYLYCIYAGFDPSKAAGTVLNLFTIHYGDGSYEKSALTQISLQTVCYTSYSSYNDYTYDESKRSWSYVTRYSTYLNGSSTCRISNGYLYLLASSRKKILRVNLKNQADQMLVKIIDDDSNDYIVDLQQIRLNNGGTFFTVYHYTTNSYEYRNGLLYEDGSFILHNFAGTNNNDDWYNNCLVNGNELESFGYYSDVTIRQGFIANYLGTVSNLSSPIEKNASQTMKITYTLTDVEDGDSSGEEVGS